jgi:hypothetical protein
MEKNMLKKVAYYEDKQYTLHTPLAPKTVIVHTKVGERDEEIPDELAAIIDKIFFFNTDIYCEGIAQVPAQDPETGAIGRQGVKFIFPADVKTQKQAFEKFDYAVDNFIEKMKQQQEEQESQIARATPEDLKLFDHLREKAQKDKKIIEIP